ncbi:MAG: o-succinylbenzoate--CoA ligase [Ignavibacteria bacterium]|nr:o-succinylbenzoate--CoA ligase [Ignavibacteria bacterium]
MKFGELSGTPFSYFDTFSERAFLIVHHSLVENSEFFPKNLLYKINPSNGFISFTYNEISNVVESMTQKMNAEEGKVNQPIPIILSNPFDLILSVLSIWRLNAIPVPLNIRLLNDELLNQIKFLSVDEIICETKNAEDFSSLKRFPFTNSFLTSKSLTTNLVFDNTAVLLFTSGTSGKPKAVPLSFGNLFAAFVTGNTLFNYSKTDSWYLNLPLYHIGGFSILTRAIYTGSSIILPESNELNVFENNLERVKPTLCSLVPTQLKRICENGIEPNNELRAVLIGGGFSNETILMNAAKLGWKIYKVYGSTETSAFVTALKPEEVNAKPNSVGKPLQNVEIKILDDGRNDTPVNTSGEIAVRTESLFCGYLNDAEATSDAFYNGYYLTGDFGFFDADGYLFLEDRRTDLIVSGGENISPNEIENVISQFPNIDEVCVFGLPDKKWGECVAVVVTSKDGNEIITSKLKIYLREKLPSFKVPKTFFQTKELPKSAIGKIKRAEVKKFFTQPQT